MGDDPNLYPLRFLPELKDYPWGGRSFEEVLGRSLPTGRWAESWEISDHPRGPTAVAGGPLAGMTLGTVQERLGEDLLGRRNPAALDRARFPLLIKLLDCRQWLSVQVHPGDDDALAREGEPGKTEMWVVLAAAAGAEIIFGFNRGVNRERFRRALAGGEPLACLHRQPARAGDVFFVPAGTIHALGPGLLVAEIQQTSDVTYRVYDWDRPPDPEKPRPLQVERALEVLDFSGVEPGAVAAAASESGGIRRQELARCRYFRTERIFLPAGGALEGRCAGETFEIWGAIEGEAVVETAAGLDALPRVSWTLLPAALGSYRLSAVAPATLLRITTPAVP